MSTLSRKSGQDVRNLKKTPEGRINALDLFCGVGGLTHGLIRGGINVIAGVDVDHNCRYSYESNNNAEFIERSVTELDPSEISSRLDVCGFSLLAGCAPCQPFSTYSQSSRKERSGKDWALASYFARLVKEVRPHLVTMENVPQIVHHSIFEDFLACLDGYHVNWQIVECSEVGVPQTRKRLVLLASRLGASDLEIKLHPEKMVTVRDTIGGLPALNAGDASPGDPLHVACRLSELNLKRIRASVPGGTWRDWDPSLRAACHTKKTGGTYPSVYGRMEWDKPAPTMTTQCFGYGNGRFGHPEQDRAITLREAAMLQTFPHDYVFVKSGERVKFSHMGRLIGNAVPVRLGEAIADAFKRYVKNYC